MILITIRFVGIFFFSINVETFRQYFRINSIDFDKLSINLTDPFISRTLFSSAKEFMRKGFTKHHILSNKGALIC